MKEIQMLVALIKHDGNCHPDVVAIDNCFLCPISSERLCGLADKSIILSVSKLKLREYSEEEIFEAML